MRVKASLFCLFILLASSISTAQELVPSDPAYALKGLKSLGVLVEGLKEKAIKIGLSEDRLRTIAELKLRREGIEVLEYGSFPQLYINVNVLSRAFNITIKIQEWVQLRRDPSIECFGVTWDDSVTGSYEGGAEYIVDTLNQALEVFLNDYYRANPKK